MSHPSEHTPMDCALGLIFIALSVSFVSCLLYAGVVLALRS